MDDRQVVAIIAAILLGTSKNEDSAYDLEDLIKQSDALLQAAYAGNPTKLANETLISFARKVYGKE